MDINLDAVLTEIGKTYRDQIQDDSRNYIEINIGQQAEKMGFKEIKYTYGDTYAIVPLRRPVKGMKVRIDGRTFVKYAQFESGVAVPSYVAVYSGLPRRTFEPNHSMILNES